jgi:phage protein D
MTLTTLAPYVKVFTTRGEISARVSDFEYEYNQKDGDRCQLDIEMTNPFIPDLPEFQEGSILKITWGFLAGESVTRTVKIADIKPAYTHDKMTLSLLCTNLAERTKHSSKPTVHKKTTLKKLQQEIATSNGLKASGTGSEQEIIKGNKAPSIQNTQGNYQSAVDNTSKPIQFRIYDVLPQANKSDMKLLKEVAEREPDGPYEVYGRDDELVVRKLPLSQKPYKRYDYGKGNYLVLSFTPETKNAVNKAEAANLNINLFDEETQDIIAGAVERHRAKDTKLGTATKVQPNSVQALRDGSAPIPSRIPSSVTKFIASKSPADNPLVKLNVIDPMTGKLKTTDPSSLPFSYTWANAANKSIARAEKDKTSAEALNDNSPDLVEALKKSPGGFTRVELPNQVIVLKPYNTQSETKQNDDGNYTQEVDKTRVVGFIPMIEAARTESEPDPEDAQNKAANRQVEAAMEMNPGNLVTLGDPKLIAGIIITVSGVAKKYSGNYYVTSCKHRMKVNGYYDVELSLHRNAVNTVEDNPVNEVSSKEVGAGETNIEPAEQEQNRYANWQLSIYNGSWTWTQKANTPIVPK